MRQRGRRRVRSNPATSRTRHAVDRPRSEPYNGDYTLQYTQHSAPVVGVGLGSSAIIRRQTGLRTDPRGRGPQGCCGTIGIGMARSIMRGPQRPKPLTMRNKGCDSGVAGVSAATPLAVQSSGPQPHT